MKDLYLKIEEREILIDLLAENGITMEGNYFQNELLIIDWIGKIPKTFNEDGEVIEWKSNEHFNVRLIDEGVILFDEFQSVFPDVPYRMFS